MDNLWPPLPLNEWRDTYATLHMWTQIVGKIRLALTPLINHWWNVPLYMSARGLTTSPMPYKNRTIEITFDFIDHQLLIEIDDGVKAAIALRPCSVADFYRDVMTTLNKLGIEVRIWPVPVEVPDPIPFQEDHKNASYDPEYANRHWRILVQANRILTLFRSRFIGKCSPVHFFWGSFDLAVTRFSGRRAPKREGADAITVEAYSHEVISHGFWPGVRSSGTDGAVRAPAFYSYTAPAPEGLDRSIIKPEKAFFSRGMGEFILLYDDVRTAENPPDMMLLEFLQTTYDSGADLAKWNRKELER